MAREFTTDWVSKNTVVWRKLLAPFIGKPNLNFLELGAYEGRSGCWWLDNVLTGPGSVLHVIDNWRKEPEREARCRANLREFIESGRVLIHREHSRQMLPQLSNHFYDFIYLDGSHEGADVLLDALLALPLLKVGGILLFDDYKWKKSTVRYHPPRPGIRSFLSLCDWQLELIHCKYQIAVRKTHPVALRQRNSILQNSILKKLLPRSIKERLGFKPAHP